MKKIFLIALLALFFVGCQQSTNDIPKINAPEVTTPTTTDPTTDTKPYYVKNSKWEDVDISKISTARAFLFPYHFTNI